ncbi:Fructose-1,6-bisphosphatase isozyme 2, partial [Frankliniella fusca]
ELCDPNNNSSGGSNSSGFTSCSPSLDLAELLAAVQAAIKAVSATLRSSGLVKWRSSREIAAEIFINYIASSQSVALLVCDEKVIPVETSGDRRGKYAVCISPLDSKQDTSDPPSVAGTVFSVHRYLEPHGRSAGTGGGGSGRPSLRSVLQPGKNLVAAGYALYASSTLLVLTTGPGVHLFVLDPVLGEFILTAPNLTIPVRGRIYSVDEGLTYEWGDPVVEYVESKKDPKASALPTYPEELSPCSLGTTYGSHHMGCAVADVHTVLRNGGIYLSPQLRSHPNGKLRLVLEAAPLAHLVCRAGGLATDGHLSLTDCQPEGLAHRTAAFMGSREDIRDLLSMFRGCGALYSTRPSGLRAGGLDALTPTPSTATASTDKGQQAAKVQRSPSKQDKERDRAAAAGAGLTASMAALSATIEALGRPTASRPTSAVYPSSTASLLGLVPSVPRPASAVSAPASSTSGAVHGLKKATSPSSLPFSLPHTLPAKKVP